MVALCKCTACNETTLTTTHAEHKLCIICRIAAAYPMYFGDCALCSLPFTTNTNNHGIFCSNCNEAMHMLLIPPQSPDSPDTTNDPFEAPHQPSQWYMCPSCMGLHPREDTWPTLPWPNVHVDPSPIIGQVQTGNIVPMQHASDWPPLLCAA